MLAGWLPPAVAGRAERQAHAELAASRGAATDGARGSHDARGAGIGIGLVIALAASNALRALLFNVSPTDVASYAGSTLLLVLVGIAASRWPARRAAGVNPADALRAE